MFALTSVIISFAVEMVEASSNGITSLKRLRKTFSASTRSILKGPLTHSPADPEDAIVLDTCCFEWRKSSESVIDKSTSIIDSKVSIEVPVENRYNGHFDNLSLRIAKGSLVGKMFGPI